MNDNSSLEDIIYKIHHLLINNNITLCTVESCTAGMLSTLLTSFPQSSKWFKGGWIVYSNLLKSQLLEKNKSFIEYHGAVSKFITRKLAIAGKKKLNTNICISITGYTDIGNSYAYICILNDEYLLVKTIKPEEFQHLDNRQSIKVVMVKKALLMIYDYIK